MIKLLKAVGCIYVPFKLATRRQCHIQRSHHSVMIKETQQFLLRKRSNVVLEDYFYHSPKSLVTDYLMDFNPAGSFVSCQVSFQTIFLLSNLLAFTYPEKPWSLRYLKCWVTTLEFCKAAATNLGIYQYFSNTHTCLHQLSSEKL